MQICWTGHPCTTEQPTCCISIAGLLLSRRFKKAAMLEGESSDFYISLLSPSRKHSGRWGGISSLFPGRLYGGSQDSALGILVLDGSDWVEPWDSRSLCNVMPSFPGFLAGWCGLLISVIVGSGDGGKALGMGVSIMGVLSFLRNLRFCRVILPDPAILYWQLGSVSTIRPAMSHWWLFWCRCHLDWFMWLSRGIPWACNAIISVIANWSIHSRPVDWLIDTCFHANYSLMSRM